MSETCSATTKRGTECRASVVVGTTFCALHGDPERAKKLGRLGGRKNRHYVETDDFTISPPTTPEEVKHLLAQAMVDVRTGKLDPRKASAITYMASTLLKAIEGTDVQRRLLRLEEARLAKVDAS